MAIKVYILLALFYFIIGLIAVSTFKEKYWALKAFILLTILLPITKFTTAFHIQLQIDVYYFFFFGLGIIYLKKGFVKKNINKDLFIGIASVLLLLLLFSLHYLFFVNESREIINILKDIKPFIVLILAYIFIDYYNDRLRDILTKKFSNRLLLLNLIVSTVFFVLMYKFKIHLLLTNDPYFEYEGLRYETLGTYFGVFYMIYLIVNKIKISFKELVLLIIPILYTGNRTLFASILLILIVYYLTKATAEKVAVFFGAFLVLLSGFIILVKKAGEESPLARFKEMLSFDFIEATLLNRFSPFLNAIKSFDTLDFIIGKGFGFTFFIPWFTWRSNIDNYNIYLDNLYLTLYAKYGILSILLFALVYQYIRFSVNTKTVIYFFLFILITSMTNAMIYQYHFLWLLLLFAFPFKSVVKR